MAQNPQTQGGPLDIGHLHEGPADVYHLHRTVYEYYIILTGWLVIHVDGEEIQLEQGDVMMIQPSEVHAVIKTSADLHALVLKTPHVPEDKVFK